MKPEAIKYEVLFLINSRFAGKHPCNKKCQQAEKCAARLHLITTEAKLFTRSLFLSFEKFEIENFDTSLNVVPAKNFIHLSVGDLVTNQKTINPYSFLSTKILN